MPKAASPHPKIFRTYVVRAFLTLIVVARFGALYLGRLVLVHPDDRSPSTVAEILSRQVA
jgi:hypothetical protein